MPEVKDKRTGQVIAKFNYDDEGMIKARQLADSDFNLQISETPQSPVNNVGAEITTSDAMERVDSYELGGSIPGEPGFGEARTPSPTMSLMGEDVGSDLMVPKAYKKGGKVKKY